SGKSIADFDDIAVGIGEIGVSETGLVFAAFEQFAAGALDLGDACFHRAFHRKTEMRQTASPDRLTLPRFAQRDEIGCAGRGEEHQPAAGRELDLQAERFFVELHGTFEIADIQMDVIEPARYDHGAPPVFVSLKIITQSYRDRDARTGCRKAAA